ncbi:MAG: hypothetical protein WCK05_10665 [Planctomycetota bacterium]
MSVDLKDGSTEQPYRSEPRLFDSRWAQVILALWIATVAAIPVLLWEFGGSGEPWYGAEGLPLWNHGDQALTPEGEKWFLWNVTGPPWAVIAVAGVFTVVSVLAVRKERPRVVTIGWGLIASLASLIVTGLIALGYSFLPYLD